MKPQNRLTPKVLDCCSSITLPVAASITWMQITLCSVLSTHRPLQDDNKWNHLLSLMLSRGSSLKLDRLCLSVSLCIFLYNNEKLNWLILSNLFFDCVCFVYFICSYGIKISGWIIYFISMRLKTERILTNNAGDYNLITMNGIYKRLTCPRTILRF